MLTIRGNVSLLDKVKDLLEAQREEDGEEERRERDEEEGRREKDGEEERREEASWKYEEIVRSQDVRVVERESSHLSSAVHANVEVEPVNVLSKVKSSKGKRILKRSEKYERERDKRRMERWIAERQANMVVAHSQVASLDSIKMGGGYIGHRQLGRSVGEAMIVPYNSGSAARIADQTGRVFVYRGFKGAATDAANESARAAAVFLAATGIAPSERNGKRGNFDQYWFILHRESQERPRMHSYFIKHAGEGLYVAAIMQPLREVVNDAFRNNFPALYAHYVEVTDFILSEAEADLVAPFYPFASFAINYGTVVCEGHIDCLNYGPGLCCIIPFGTFDPTESGRIVLEEAGVEVEAGPGIPVFIPSALFTHRNTALMNQCCRGSIVLWSNGSLFQYYDLGGRTVNSLGPQEKQRYHAFARTRILEGVHRFPMIA